VLRASLLWLSPLTDTTAFYSDVVPDLFQVRLGLGRDAVRHSSARDRRLACEPASAALLHFVRESSGRVFRNRSSFAASERCLRFVDSGQDLIASAFAFFPEGERFRDSFLHTVKSSAVDGAANERSLVWSELDFHMQLNARDARWRYQGTNEWILMDSTNNDLLAQPMCRASRRWSPARQQPLGEQARKPVPAN
jgi:hypothetical protein